jgi:hypothetical protein
MHHRVVGRVQRLAVVAVGQHCDGSVVFIANHAAIEMLTGDLPPFPVKGIAVAVARRIAEGTDMPVFIEPAKLDIGTDVAPD